MKRQQQGGWVLFEAMFATVCVAFIVGVMQQQLNQLTQQMVELQRDHQHTVQNALQVQMSKIFAQSPALTSTVAVAPRCEACRGAQLNSLLQYELSQW